MTKVPKSPSKDSDGRDGIPSFASFRRANRQVYELLSSRERRWLLGILAGMLLLAVVETAGVGSIAPFTALLSDPGLIQENEVLNWLFNTLGFDSTFSFLFFAGASLLAVIVFSNGFSALITWLMLRFVWRLHHRISKELLQRYLWQPYNYFITRNTADLSTNILSEVQSVTAGLLVPAMKALSRAVVAIFILGLLIYVDPQVALVAGSVLGGMYGVTYLGVRKTLGDVGERRLETNARRFRMAAEALQGIKDVKILGREDDFLERYSRPSYYYSRHSATSAIVSSLPRFALEAIAFGGLVALTLYLMATREDFRQAIPMVSLYAFAGYRLMPALQEVFGAFSRLRFYEAPLARLHSDMEGESSDLRSTTEVLRANGNDRDRLRLHEGLEIRDLKFSYPGSDRPAIDGVSLSVQKNETVGFVGATGCGKTTLVDLIMGLLRPGDGGIFIDDIELRAENARRWQRNLGYVPQEIYLCDDSIARNIAFGLPDDDLDRGRVERAARIAKIHDYIQTLPASYETVVGDRGVRLSGGQRQRIGIARALYHNPEVLILDEATSALDGVTENAVMEAIRELTSQKTIFVIAHRLTTVKDANMIYLLDEGKITDRGSYADLMQRSADFRAMARQTG